MLFYVCVHILLASLSAWVSLCMLSHTDTHTHTHTYTHTHTHTHTHTPIHLYKHRIMYLFISSRRFMHVNIHSYLLNASCIRSPDDTFPSILLLIPTNDKSDVQHVLCSFHRSVIETSVVFGMLGWRQHSLHTTAITCRL